MAAITAVSSSSDAQTELVRYQQKLATDLAAKAAAKVITADKEAVAKARQTVQQTSGTGTPAAATAGTVLDVTV